MYVPPPDRALSEEEWRGFVQRQGFGHFIAAGAGRAYPAVAPTQFVLDDGEVLAHFAAGNPVLAALGEFPWAVLSVAGEWAFIPSEWKATGPEDPLLGIPTTYYGAVQLRGRAVVMSDDSAIADVLRRQLRALQPGVPVADPEEAHPAKLRAIRAVVLTVEDVVAKFKYGGNVDDDHRRQVIRRLRDRGGTGDLAAAARAEERSRPGRPLAGPGAAT